MHNRATAWAVCGLLLVFASTATANIGERWHGHLSKEPDSGIAEVVITHEELTIDLRPLADFQPVRVEVTYHLHNPGAVKRAKLVFVSGTEMTDSFEVRLNEQVVAAKAPGRYIDAYAEAPWNDLSNRSNKVRFTNTQFWSFGYPASQRLLPFDVAIPSGTATLTVRYQARALGCDETEPTTTWSFPYILAPARTWGGFGGLDVTVHIPEGWEWRAAPDLTWEGGVLRGHFKDLPADELRIAVRLPVPASYKWRVRLAIGLYVLGLLGGGLLCWWGAGFAGRRASTGLRCGLALGVAVLLSVLWAACVYGGWWFGVSLVLRSLRGQEAPYLHEAFAGPKLLTFCLVPVVFLGGLALTLSRVLRLRPAALAARASGRGTEPASPDLPDR